MIPMLESGQKVRIKATGELGFVQRPVAFADDLGRRGLYGFYYLVNLGNATFIPGWEAGRWLKPEEIETVK